MGYLIKVILTGLITAAMLPEQDPERVLALALDDGSRHQAMLILMEGTCVPEEGYECHRLVEGVDPKGLRDFGLAWNLEQEDMKYLDLRLDGPESGIGRRKVIGDLGELPQWRQQTDFRWSPSLVRLAEAAGADNPKLREECKKGDPSACDLVTRLEVGFGEIASCHLVHLTDYSPPGPNACEFDERMDEGAAAVLRHEFVRDKSALEEIQQAGARAQAVSDAVSIDYTSADATSLKLMVNGSHAATLQPDPGTRRLVLVLLNQPVGPVFGDGDRVEQAADRHDHFDKFYRLLEPEPADTERLAPKVPHLQSSQRATIGPGPCERYFECLSAVFDVIHTLDEEQFERPELLPSVPQMPHNPSQCDVPTYP
jgi:hypothetical protein